MALTNEDLQYTFAVDVDEKSAKVVKDLVADLDKVSSSAPTPKEIAFLKKQWGDVTGAKITAQLGGGGVGGVADAAPRAAKAFKELVETVESLTSRMGRATAFHEVGDLVSKMEKGAEAPVLEEDKSVEVDAATVADQLKSAFKKGGVGGVFGEMGGLFKEGLKGFKLGDLFGGTKTGGAGGGVGGFLGATGPVGMLLALAPSVGKVLGQVTAPLKSFAGALRDLQGPLGPLGAALNLVAAPMKAFASVIKEIPVVGAVLGPFADALAEIPALIGDITNSLVNMAAKASPGAFKLWQRALDDVQGVIGRAFVPILQLMTETVRAVGDAFATFLPNMSEAREALEPLASAWREFNTMFREVAGDFGPIVREGIIIVLRMIGHHFQAIAAMARPFLEMLRVMAYLMGVSTGKGVKGNRSSFGGAAQPASIGGLEQYQTGLQTAAYGAGFGGGKKPEEQTVDLLTSIEGILGDLYDFMLDLPDLIVEGLENIWNNILKAVLDLPLDLADAIGQFIPGYEGSAHAGQVGLAGVGGGTDVYGTGGAKEAAEQRQFRRERYAGAGGDF